MRGEFIKYKLLQQAYQPALEEEFSHFSS